LTCGQYVVVTCNIWYNDMQMMCQLCIKYTILKIVQSYKRVIHHLKTTFDKTKKLANRIFFYYFCFHVIRVRKTRDANYATEHENHAVGRGLSSHWIGPFSFLSSHRRFVFLLSTSVLCVSLFFLF
jgi:hypothetical protein